MLKFVIKGSVSRMGKINYLFDSAFLDLQNTQTFTELCKKNKVISKDIDGSIVSYDGTPLRGMKRLLRDLVLFENIDFSSSIYDCSQLIERELISEKSICCSNNNPNMECDKQAICIMSAYKSDIIKQNVQIYKDHLHMLQSSYSPNCDFWKGRDYRTINKICISENLYLNLDDNYYYIIQNLDYLYGSIVENNHYKFFYELFNGDAVSNLIGIKNNLAYAFQSIEKNNSVYISNNLNHLQGKKIKNNLDSVYALVQTSLPEEVNILPMPTTLQDVWDMRKHPSISVFRKVMSEWNYYIQTDDINAAMKIKKDIVKANHGLEKLGKYKKFVSSPYVRTGLFSAGFIPVLSEIVNVYSFVEPYISNFVDKKYNWTHINDYKGLTIM